MSIPSFEYWANYVSKIKNLTSRYQHFYMHLLSLCKLWLEISMYLIIRVVQKLSSLKHKTASREEFTNSEEEDKTLLVKTEDIHGSKNKFSLREICLCFQQL